MTDFDEVTRGSPVLQFVSLSAADCYVRVIGSRPVEATVSAASADEKKRIRSAAASGCPALVKREMSAYGHIPAESDGRDGRNRCAGSLAGRMAAFNGLCLESGHSACAHPPSVTAVRNAPILAIPVGWCCAPNRKFVQEVVWANSSLPAALIVYLIVVDHCRGCKGRSGERGPGASVWRPSCWHERRSGREQHY